MGPNADRGLGGGVVVAATWRGHDDQKMAGAILPPQKAGHSAALLATSRRRWPPPRAVREAELRRCWIKRGDKRLRLLGQRWLLRWVCKIVFALQVAGAGVSAWQAFSD